MSLSVTDRVRAVATFRFIEVSLMEIAAAWTPTTPEMEVKVMFGRHIFDFAQHADALGKRTFELRQPEQYTLKPDAAYLTLLDSIRAGRSTAERLASLYNVIVPGLIRRYEDYISKTDPILDEPSVDIMKRIVSDLRRQSAQAQAVMNELRITAPAVTPLIAQESGIARLVAAT